MEEDKNKVGAPTKYKEEFNEQVFKLCLLGATDAEIADFFEVHIDTIQEWKKVYSEFSYSIAQGKTKADIEVANSLYKTTQDRVVKKQVPFKTRNVEWVDGKKIETEVVEIVEIEETIPADFRSQSFWLRNRKSATWREKSEVDSTINQSVTWVEEKTYDENDKETN